VNTVLLLLAAFASSGPASLSRLTAVFTAIGVFSIEMQAVTWLGAGSMRSLVVVNAVVAAVACLRRTPMLGRLAPAPPREVRWRDAAPLAAVGALALLVIALNLGRPLEAADPYHLDKVQRIEATGTIAYDRGADPKLNIVSSTYEIVFADLQTIPIAGAAIARLHGVLGLLLYVLALAAARELFDAGDSWYWAVMLVVPVVFHQFVLVKNDLLVGVPGFVALAWAVARADLAPRREVAWAAALAAFAVAVKFTMAPVWIVLAAVVLLRRRDRGASILMLAAGSLVGILAGGLVFAVVENWRFYGSPMPTAGIGDRNATTGAVLVSIGRFAISLVDLGTITRTVWPGRGGWGGTFGLPLMWALAVLGWRSRISVRARLALAAAAVAFVAFAAAFPDADLAQRLMLAPGLLLVFVAVDLAARDRALPKPLRAVVPVIVILSAAQIARSAVLYFQR
jgi:hypothetical protein